MVNSRRDRRYQKGVAAAELAIGLPILILVIGSIVTVGSLAHTKIKLDSLTSMATRTCAMKQSGATPEEAQTCITEWLTTHGMTRCQEVTTTVEIDDWTVPFVDDETGEALTSSVPIFRVRVDCPVTTMRLGNFVNDTVITAVATAGRN